MSKCIGSKWTGIVSEVGVNYIKVLLPNMVSGKVHIYSKDYTLSKDNFSLISNKNDERILVGDTINIEVSGIDIQEGIVTFIRESSPNKVVTNEKEKKKIKSR